MARRARQRVPLIRRPRAVLDRFSRVSDAVVIDHRGPDFIDLGKIVLSSIQSIFKTKSPVVIYQGTRTGEWEACLANLLVAGDLALMYETEQFATLWKQMADRLGIETELSVGIWRYGVDANQIEERLRQDTAHTIRVVRCGHHETSSGITSHIASVPQAIDATSHSAVSLIDGILGLGVVDYEQDGWGADATISGFQEGLMKPPCFGLDALSERAIKAA